MDRYGRVIEDMSIVLADRMEALSKPV